jgi:hypothetical protein
MSPLYSNLHSCSLCSPVILDASGLSFAGEELLHQEVFDLGFSLHDAVKAAKDGCNFFACFIPSPDDPTDYSELFNTADTTRITLSYWNMKNLMK